MSKNRQAEMKEHPADKNHPADKEISHQQAQRWIQAHLDQALSPADASRLEAHLLGCPACREYAAHIQALDTDLRHLFHSRSLPTPALSPRAIDTIFTQTRTHMNTKRISNLVASASFALLMIALVGGLFLLLSLYRYGSLPQPARPVEWPSLPQEMVPDAAAGGGRYPTVPLTPTQAADIYNPAWSITTPLTSSVQIIPILDELALRNVARFQAAGWVHSQSSDLGQPGAIQTSFIEEWVQYPRSADACPQRLTLVKDQPGGSKIYQVQIYLEDGTYGDLTQLQQGDGGIQKLTPGSPGCTLQPGNLAAGVLALRIAGKSQGKSQSEMLKDVRAWYETGAGRSVFVVQATFEGPAPWASTGRTIETVSFDLQSGVEVRRHTQMQYADGAPVGETLNGIQVEYPDDLPGEVAQQFENYRAELEAYVCASSALPCPATLQAPAIHTAVAGQTFDRLQNLLDTGYAQDKPLQDGELILQLLSALRQKHLAWMAKPGWYLYTPNLGDTQGEPDTRYILTHVIDDAGRCESLAYYQRGEQMLPQEILLADNRWGLIGTIADGSFTEGEANHAPCRLEAVESVTMLDIEIDYFRDLLDGKIQGDYQAWTQEIDGRRVLALHFDVQHERPQPTVMDPDTRQLEIINRTLEWQYFDLEHGGWVGAKEQFYLANGKVLGFAPQPDDRLSAQYQALDRLPEDLQGVFEATSTRLGEYLAKARP